MDRSTLMWTIVVFFGASVLFGLIGNATEGESVVLTLALELAAGLLVIGLLVAYVRRGR
jgi:hypothetical protein